MKNVCIFFVLLLLVACSSVPSMEGFVYQEVKIDGLKIATWRKGTKPFEKMRIYIDGNAQTVGIFKKKPKMYADVAKQLALKDKFPSVAYIGRPCYFIEQDICRPIAWEEGKYAPEFIDTIQKIIIAWQKKYKLSQVELVGYDGGAAIALSIASHLPAKNVNKVITIGGILDTQTDAMYKDEDILPLSVNPVKDLYMLSRIPQIHYIGGKDKVAPEFMIKNFVEKIPNSKEIIQMKRLPNADHFNWAQFKLDY